MHIYICIYRSANACCRHSLASLALHGQVGLPFLRCALSSRRQLSICWLSKGTRRTKNTTRIKFTTSGKFTLALWLLSRCALCWCWHHFPGNYRHFSSRRRVRSVSTIGNSRITFHHFIFRELFLVIISSWFTSKTSGRIISRNLSGLLLLPHLPQHTQSLHQKILGELFFVKISCPLHQNILGELIS